MTTKQFLLELLEACGEQAVFNFICSIESFEHLERLCSRKDMAHRVLSTSFIWDDTEQGFEYWTSVYDSLRMVSA